MTCLLAEPGASGSVFDAVGPAVTNPVEGQDYLLLCSDENGPVSLRRITYSARPAATPQTLARFAARDLPLLYPHPATAPPSGGTQLVGVRTWLWVDPADMVDVTGSASVPGLTVTATAHPESVTWDFGDGSEPLTCPGSGTAYDPSVPDRDQHTDCGHGFRRAGSYVLTATIDWHVTWSASDGTSGDLGTIPRGVQVPVTVEARQAVITG